MTSPGLLQLLRCPETRQELRPAGEAQVSNINRQIAEGVVKNRAGQPVRELIDGGLVRADGKYLYPVRKGIPVMLREEALALVS